MNAIVSVPTKKEQLTALSKSQEKLLSFIAKDYRDQEIVKDTGWEADELQRITISLFDHFGLDKGAYDESRDELGRIGREHGFLTPAKNDEVPPAQIYNGFDLESTVKKIYRLDNDERDLLKWYVYSERGQNAHERKAAELKVGLQTIFNRLKKLCEKLCAPYGDGRKEKLKLAWQEYQNRLNKGARTEYADFKESGEATPIQEVVVHNQFPDVTEIVERVSKLTLKEKDLLRFYVYLGSIGSPSYSQKALQLGITKQTIYNRLNSIFSRFGMPDVPGRRTLLKEAWEQFEVEYSEGLEMVPPDENAKLLPKQHSVGTVVPLPADVTDVYVVSGIFDSKEPVPGLREAIQNRKEAGFKPGFLVLTSTDNPAVSHAQLVFLKHEDR